MRERVSCVFVASAPRCAKELAVSLLKRLARDESGMETVEWAILAALIVAGLVAVITTLGNNVLNKFTTLRNATQ